MTVEWKVYTNEEIAAEMAAAGYEEGCERNFGRANGICQCEECGQWGITGEIVLQLDEGDYCTDHLPAN